MKTGELAPSLELQFMAKTTELILYPEKMVRYLGVKTPALKFDSRLNCEQIKQVAEKYRSQRDESVQILTEFLIDEQKRFLSEGTVDVNLRKYFRGLDIQDNITVKRIVAELRTSEPAQEYDERNCFNLLWALNVSCKRHWIGVVGEAKHIVESIKKSKLSDELKTFPIGYYDVDFNYLIPNGSAVVVLKRSLT